MFFSLGFKGGGKDTRTFHSKIVRCRKTLIKYKKTFAVLPGALIRLKLAQSAESNYKAKVSVTNDSLAEASPQWSIFFIRDPNLKRFSDHRKRFRSPTTLELVWPDISTPMTSGESIQSSILSLIRLVIAE